MRDWSSSRRQSSKSQQNLQANFEYNKLMGDVTPTAETSAKHQRQKVSDRKHSVPQQSRDTLTSRKN